MTNEHIKIATKKSPVIVPQKKVEIPLPAPSVNRRKPPTPKISQPKKPNIR
jgi:hypothetical protein